MTSRSKRARRGSGREAQIQKYAVHLLNSKFPDALTFHVPNEGLRSYREGAHQKEMGVRAGTPDLVLVSNDNRIMFIEVKKPGGRLTQAQREFAEECELRNIPHEVVENEDDVLEVLTKWQAQNLL